MLLKLVEHGIEELKPDDNVSEKLIGNTAILAEKYLRKSVDHCKTNKLSQANLCLLYATPFFRKEKEKYLRKCLYHGLEAVEIDPKYINGYRDLALSMIRYKKFNEAYTYYEKALFYSKAIDKDQEIIEDALSVLKEVGISDEAMARWVDPNPDLFKPPHGEQRVSGIETRVYHPDKQSGQP